MGDPHWFWRKVTGGQCGNPQRGANPKGHPGNPQAPEGLDPHPPLLFGAVALIYGFFVAEPTYASTATLSVAPVQVQAQLEQRIQVQQATPITFEGLKALALSEEAVGEVWEALRKEGRLPTRWQDQGNLRGVERMLRDLRVKDISPRVQAANPNQVPPSSRASP